MACPSVQPLWELPGWSQKLHSSFMSRNGLCHSLVIPHWQRSLTLILSLTAGDGCTCSTDSRKKGTHGAVFLMSYSLWILCHLHFLCMSVQFPKFLDQWRIITSNRFVLDILKGQLFQPGCFPPLSPNFR